MRSLFSLDGRVALVTGGSRGIGRMIAHGLIAYVQTSMTKLFMAETVRSIVLDCQTIMGAYGYAEGFATERYARGSLVLPIFGGSSAIQRNNIASLMRLPRA